MTSLSGISILVINGPNLNLLGTREPGIYGSATLADVEAQCKRTGEEQGASSVQAFQSNYEGAIVERIHEARQDVDAIVINAGGSCREVSRAVYPKLNPSTFTVQVPTRTPRSPSATRSPAPPSPLSRCTSPTYTRASRFGIPPTCPTRPWA